MFGEFAAFVFIPLVFAGLNSIIKNEKNKDYLLLIIGAVGLIISHLLSTIITCIFAFIYLILNIKKVLNLENIKKILVSIVLILMISSYFLVPMLEHTFRYRV